MGKRHAHLSLLSQDGGCVERVAVEGRFLAAARLALAGPDDCGGRQRLPSTPGPCLHPAAGLRLHSLQICLWEVRLTSPYCARGSENMKAWAWPQLGRCFLWLLLLSWVADDQLPCQKFASLTWTLAIHFNTIESWAEAEAIWEAGRYRAFPF